MGWQSVAEAERKTAADTAADTVADKSTVAVGTFEHRMWGFWALASHW